MSPLGRWIKKKLKSKQKYNVPLLGGCIHLSLWADSNLCMKKKEPCSPGRYIPCPGNMAWSNALVDYTNFPGVHWECIWIWAITGRHKWRLCLSSSFSTLELLFLISNGLSGWRFIPTILYFRTSWVPCHQLGLQWWLANIQQWLCFLPIKTTKCKMKVPINQMFCLHHAKLLFRKINIPHPF